jgi:Na+/melibiose symporter-like transporter
VVFFAIAFLTTKERIQPDPSQKSSLGQDLTDLMKNGPWIALFALTVFLFIALPLRGSMMYYYFKYCLVNEKLFSLFNVFGLASLIVGILFSTALAARFGKRNVFIVGLSIATVLTALLVILPAGSMTLIFVVEVIRQFAYGWTCPLLWAMVADVADYSEWKTGRRATGMVSSAIVFGLKVGLGLGLAIGGWLLSAYGYDANAAAQPAEALVGIRLTASVFPALSFLVGIVCLFLYKIDKQLNIQMMEELAERRKGYAS